VRLALLLMLATPLGMDTITRLEVQHRSTVKAINSIKHSLLLVEYKIKIYQATYK